MFENDPEVKIVAGKRRMRGMIYSFVLEKI